MTRSLAHRGPDGEGIHVEGVVGLGHRRLAVIDLSERGQQPMASADRALWITYNGEIYNFREVRSDLESRGTPLPLQLRHGGAAPGIQRVGRGLYRTMQRDVRVRHLGRAPAASVDRPGPPWREAPLLLPPPRLLRLRVGDQGNPVPPGGGGFSRHGGAGLLSRAQLHARASHSVRRHPPAASRAPPDRLARRSRPGPSVLGSRPAQTRASTDGDLDRGVPAPAGRFSADPPGERRAIRCVPERGCRLEQRCLLDVEAPVRACQDVHDRLPRGVVQRASVGAPGRRLHRRRASRGDRGCRSRRRLAPPRLARGGADCGLVDGCLIPPRTT